MFYLAEFLNLSSRKASSDSSEGLHQEVREDLYEFYNRSQVDRMSKDLLLIKESQTFELINVALFPLWEDARVRAYYNHSFDIHATALGASSLLLCILNPLRVCSSCVAAMAENMVSATSFVHLYGRHFFFLDTHQGL